MSRALLPATRSRVPRLFSSQGRVAGLLLLLAVAAACASSPEVRTYQSISTCNVAAQSAARAFGILYQTHKAENPALWGDRYDKAEAAYQSYQKVALAAVDAAKTGGETTAVLITINEALSQYTALVTAFGVKL
jgi:transposase